MKTYGLKYRPFGIGTFPNVSRESYFELEKAKTGFYSMIETTDPLSEEEVRKYELVKLTDKQVEELKNA